MINLILFQVKLTKRLAIEISLELLLEITGLDAIADAISDSLEVLLGKVEKTEQICQLNQQNSEEIFHGSTTTKRYFLQQRMRDIYNSQKPRYAAPLSE